MKLVIILNRGKVGHGKATYKLRGGGTQLGLLIGILLLNWLLVGPVVLRKAQITSVICGANVSAPHCGMICGADVG